jgi:hypothetical protein
MQPVHFASRFVSRASLGGLFAACLIGFSAVGGCSKSTGIRGTNTGGSTATGGTLGSGGEVGHGGNTGTGAAFDASVPLDASTCKELAQSASTQFQAYLDRTASLTCQAASDCTLLHLQSLNCFAACGLLVGQGSSASVTADAVQVCDPYVAAGCPEIRLTCPAAQTVCDRGRCAYAVPGITEPAIDGSADRPTANDVAADAGLDGDAPSACSSPSVGAACTPDQTPCATCCIDRWTCSGGVWQNQFIGCLPTGFVCGDQWCNEGQHYCHITPALDYGEFRHPVLYSCVTLPAPCHGNRCPTCDCLAQAGIAFTSCAANAIGYIQVTW